MSTVKTPVVQTARTPELAGALLRAIRAWTMYPPDHPATQAPVDTLCSLLNELAADSRLRVAVTPSTLIVNGTEADPSGPHVGEAARRLHALDVLQLRFDAGVSTSELRALLALLKLDASTLRSRGGPERLWHEVGSPSIGLEQIDYGQVLRRTSDEPASGARDCLWTNIVRSLLDHGPMDVESQQRLVSIARDASQLNELLDDVQSQFCSADGSPLITSRARAVLHACHRLTEVASIQAPESMADVVHTLASVGARLSGSVVKELLRLDDDLASNDGVDVQRHLVASMSDSALGSVVADTVIQQGVGSDRLAWVARLLDSSARRGDVLDHARAALDSTLADDPARALTLWGSLEELAARTTSNDYAPQTYRRQLEEAGERAHQMSVAGMPAERDAWLATLGPEQVRRSSVTLLTDLLALEPTETQAARIVSELDTTADDLLMAGDLPGALEVVEALIGVRDRDRPPSAQATDALTRVASSVALEEAATLAPQLTPSGLAALTAIVRLLGPPALDAVVPVLVAASPPPGLVETVAAFGESTVQRLEIHARGDDPAVQQRVARLLGRTGAASATALLEPMLQSKHPVVAYEALRALLELEGTAAARLVARHFRLLPRDRRGAVVASIVAGDEAEPASRRVAVLSQILARVLDGLEPFGRDHGLALDVVHALGTIGDTRAVPVVARALRRRHWLHPGRTRALRRAAVEALAISRTAAGLAALSEAAASRDRQLRRLAGRRLVEAGPPSRLEEAA